MHGQDDLCRELVEWLGLAVSSAFVDNDVSASSRPYKVRPEYAEMLRRARLGEHTAILAYSNSRLATTPKRNQLRPN
jgi:DNA invertase Pin-like site-specific DNA recombinase